MWRAKRIKYMYLEASTTYVQTVVVVVVVVIVLLKVRIALKEGR